MREDLVERVARAISGLDDKRWGELGNEGRSVYAPDFSGRYDQHFLGKTDYRNRARTAIAEIEAAGFVIVPREPTEAMIDAAAEVLWRDPLLDITQSVAETLTHEILKRAL